MSAILNAVGNWMSRNQALSCTIFSAFFMMIFVMMGKMGMASLCFLIFLASFFTWLDLWGNLLDWYGNAPIAVQIFLPALGALVMSLALYSFGFNRNDNGQVTFILGMAGMVGIFFSILIGVLRR